MKKKLFDFEDSPVLDIAIIALLAAILLAAAVPLVRGAILRQRTAECARKIMRAADAFDFYARAVGRYPESRNDPRTTAEEMKGAFTALDIDWWTRATDLGGQWNWYHDAWSSSVVISGQRVSEQWMTRLDTLLDDGDLETGVFQRRGPRYHYIIRDAIL
jgi:hypothetical protein